jgi:hypothetical protein
VITHRLILRITLLAKGDVTSARSRPSFWSVLCVVRYLVCVSTERSRCGDNTHVMYMFDLHSSTLLHPITMIWVISRSVKALSTATVGLLDSVGCVLPRNSTFMEDYFTEIFSFALPPLSTPIRCTSVYSALQLLHFSWRPRHRHRPCPPVSPLSEPDLSLMLPDVAHAESPWSPPSLTSCTTCGQWQLISPVVDSSPTSSLVHKDSKSLQQLVWQNLSLSLA